MKEVDIKTALRGTPTDSVFTQWYGGSYGGPVTIIIDSRMKE